MGIILWELLHFKPPWKEFKYPSQVMERVVKGLRPKVLPSRESLAPNGYCDLMRQCWHGNPSHRPDFTVIAKKLREMIQRCPKQPDATETLLLSTLSENDVLPIRISPENPGSKGSRGRDMGDGHMDNFDDVRREYSKRFETTTFEWKTLIDILLKHRHHRVLQSHTLHMHCILRSGTRRQQRWLIGSSGSSSFTTKIEKIEV